MKFILGSESKKSNEKGYLSNLKTAAYFNRIKMGIQGL